MHINERIAKLRQQMATQNIDIYIIPPADFHQSEYVGDYFKARAFMTGFTGSAGIAVFTKDKAGLWTDGRYFIQATKELADSGIHLYKMGEPGVPTIYEFLAKELPEDGTIGFDGRTVEVAEGLKYQEIAATKNARILYTHDLVDAIWEDRSPLPNEPAFLLSESYAGETVISKLARVRATMQREGATVHMITSLDDIAWLLNVRGADIKHSPFVLSYLVVWPDRVDLYAAREKFSAEILATFEAANVQLHPYEEIYEDVKKLHDQEVLWIDPKRFNYTLYANIPAAVKVLQQENPTVLMKSVKNEIEAANSRQAHLKDGVANTKFMYWLKNHPNPEEITELSASAKLEAFRQEQEHFLEPSFAPICAFREHAAMAHYSSTVETNVSFAGGGLFLTDTGGHYLDGSTDITRTYVIGEVSQQEKEHFTIVAIGMLSLADVKFLYGCDGRNLDYVARAPFWQRGLNYNHGTGHGVGHLGSIHEAPINLLWQKRPTDPPPFEEYMVISDEPGIYFEGAYGIRIENELLVRKGEKNEYGQFMYFEPLTFVPIDLDGIVPELMAEREIDLLNTYHQQVYERISPHLTQEEAAWLKKYTRKITQCEVV